MKNMKMITRLEKAFKWIGYFILLASIAAVFMTIYNYSLVNPYTPEGVSAAETKIFYFLPQFKTLIVLLTQAFFVLLVSHVFALLRGGSEERYHFGDRLMLVTCVGFTLQGILGFIGYVYSIIKFKMTDAFGNMSSIYMNISYAVSALSELMPVLYALTILVLYRHFVQMVSFESEVV